MEKKPAWKSKTINASAIGAVISLAAIVLSSLGVIDISQEEQTALTQNSVILATSAVTLLTSIISIYGRFKAKHEITL